MAKTTIKNRYGVTPNDLLNDKNISLRAKGLYAYIQSKPEGWDFSVRNIAFQCKEGRDAISVSVQELEDAGYLVRTKKHSSGGFWEIEYTLNSYPKQKTSDWKTSDGKTVNGETSNGKPVEQSNKELSKKEISNKEENTDAVAIAPIRKDIFVKPTVNEVLEYCKERGNSVNPQHFVDYYISNGWKVGRNTMKDWKAAIRTWEKNNVYRSSGFKQNVHRM